MDARAGGAALRSSSNEVRRTSFEERAQRATILVEYFPLGVETAKRLFTKLAALR